MLIDIEEIFINLKNGDYLIFGKLVYLIFMVKILVIH